MKGTTDYISFSIQKIRLGLRNNDVKEKNWDLHIQKFHSFGTGFLLSVRPEEKIFKPSVFV